MSTKRPKGYLIANNGIKIELKGSGPVTFYVQKMVRDALSAACQMPEDMLFPTEVLALTDKNKLEGELDVQV